MQSIMQLIRRLWSSEDCNISLIFMSFCLFSEIINRTYAHKTEDEFEDVLLCRACGHDIVKASDLKNIPAKTFLNKREDTVLGVPDILVQLLQNPNRAAFEVITAKDAHVEVDPKVYRSDSWFEDTAWQITRCPRCRSQIGWKYQPIDFEDEDDEEIFHGLILNRLVHEDYANAVVLKHMSHLS
ncbi:uncharacterized protein LOC117101428 [Anneissia japonica]|uniref:uncharacterized protein LOC117101428 n=1 Tax=Anneissia japonica TaxID=1529436 RepID=UPI001425637E|nr:uncharacterized protein LOC117101428 [Anneissia japonica]